MESPNISHMCNWPRISVVIATLNRASYLKRTLDKLIEDDYVNSEIIVVDGGSGDDTVDVIKSYGLEITRWISEADRGEADALNKGIMMATGEIIKPMSDDDVLRPGSLATAAKYFFAYPNIQILFGQAITWDSRRVPPIIIDDSPKMDVNSLVLSNQVRRTTPLPNSITAFVKKDLYDSIGLYATDFVAVDVEFWARAVSNKAVIRIAPEIFVDYWFTGENGVIRNRLAIKRDLVRIAMQYGNYSDIIFSAYKFLFVVGIKILAPPAHAINFHPLQWLSTIRRQLNSR